jgi:uncharacterized protein (TIGR00369 family)
LKISVAVATLLFRRLAGKPGLLRPRGAGQVRQPSGIVPESTKIGIRMTEIGRAHSGFAELLGYRITGRGKDFAEITMKIGPQHLNRLSIPHGGVMATLLDSAAGFAVSYIEHPDRPRLAVTISINVMFLGQVRQGETVIARGRRIGGGKTIAYATADVETADARPVARAEAVFRYLDKV